MMFSSACSSSSWTTILLSVSLCIYPAVAVSPAATLFNIPTGSDAGSCTENLDPVVSEASAMAQAAITAINNYQRQSIFKTPTQAVLNTYDAAWAMFGVSGTKALGRVSISSAGSATLDTVKTNYQNAINLLNSPSTLANGKAVLACDDSILTFITQLQDLNTNLKGTPAGQQTLVSAYADSGVTFPSSVQGFYYSNWKNSNIMIQDEGVKNPDGSPGGGLCTQTTTKAETWANYGFMLCCDNFFKLAPSLAGVVGAQGGISTGTNIETYLSQPGAFLHEIMHFLGTNTAGGAKIVDQEINDDKAYTWTQCSLLGTNIPAEALTNADSYHYFALASYLGSTNFGTDGISQ